MRFDPDDPRVQRALSGGIVAMLHLALVVLLITQSETVQGVLRPLVPATLLPPPPAEKPKPPEVQVKVPPVPMPVPVPEVVVGPPPGQSNAPVAVVRVPFAKGPPVSHFGSAGEDTGLAVRANTGRGGGAQGRGSLGDFDAAVKRAVLRRKRQPFLAFGRRRDCVVNYTVTVARNGALAGLSVDPCAVPEINAQAEEAIRAAAPFPPPPDLGAPTYDVHGTLIYTDPGTP